MSEKKLSIADASYFFNGIEKALIRYYLDFIRTIINQCYNDKATDEISTFRMNVVFYMNHIQKDIMDEHKKFLACLKRPAFVQDCIEDLNALFLIIFPGLGQGQNVEFQPASSEEVLMTVVLNALQRMHDFAPLVQSTGKSKEAREMNKMLLIMQVRESVADGIHDSIMNTYVVNNRLDRMAVLREVKLDDEVKIRIPEYKLNEMIREVTGIPKRSDESMRSLNDRINGTEHIYRPVGWGNRQYRYPYQQSQRRPFTQLRTQQSAPQPFAPQPFVPQQFAPQAPQLFAPQAPQASQPPFAQPPAPQAPAPQAQAPQRDEIDEEENAEDVNNPFRD